MGKDTSSLTSQLKGVKWKKKEKRLLKGAKCHPLMRFHYQKERTLSKKN